MIFFITGLPRSRTNWFAHYFSGLQDVYCYHEAMNGCHSDDDFYQRMTFPRVKHVGNSDSGLMFSRFQQQFMGAPTVIIERDPAEVEASLELMGFPGGGEFLQRQLGLLGKLDGLRVAFEDINERLPEIHSYFNIPFDSDYAEAMCSTNLQETKFNIDLESVRFWTGG